MFLPIPSVLRNIFGKQFSWIQTLLWRGLFCLGCCWALMLLMFAMGVANLVWMAALTAMMVFEKNMPGGEPLNAPRRMR